MLQALSSAHLLQDVANQAAGGLGKVLGLGAASLVEATVLDAQSTHAQALADIDLAGDRGCACKGGTNACMSGRDM